MSNQEDIEDYYSRVSALLDGLRELRSKLFMLGVTTTALRRPGQEPDEQDFKLALGNDELPDDWSTDGKYHYFRGWPRLLREAIEVLDSLWAAFVIANRAAKRLPVELFDDENCPLLNRWSTRFLATLPLVYNCGVLQPHNRRQVHRKLRLRQFLVNVRIRRCTNENLTEVYNALGNFENDVKKVETRLSLELRRADDAESCNANEEEGPAIKDRPQSKEVQSTSTDCFASVREWLKTTRRKGEQVAVLKALVDAGGTMPLAKLIKAASLDWPGSPLEKQKFYSNLRYRMNKVLEKEGQSVRLRQQDCEPVIRFEETKARRKRNTRSTKGRRKR